MDLARQKRAVSTAVNRSVVTRSQAAATIVKSEYGKLTFAKRKAESPMKMLNKKTVFKDLTNREQAVSSHSKLHDDKIAAATKKFAKAKISEQSVKTSTQVSSRARGTKGLSKAESAISFYFRSTKTVVTNEQNEMQKAKKPVVSQIKTDVRDKALPTTEEGHVKKPGVPGVTSKDAIPDATAAAAAAPVPTARDSLSSRGSISPLYVTALENISSEENESPKPDSSSPWDPTIPPKRDLPPGVTDFDAENWCDPFQVSNYATDIFNYFKSMEPNFKIPDYINHQSDISTGIRTVVVDWMIELQENFELNHETLYLAVKLFDAYLSKVQVKRNLLQLVAATSLFIASKYDERFPPSVEDHLYVCEGAYTKNQLMAMEINILKNVDFNLGFPISYRFLRRYARFGKVSMPTLTLARYILEFSLMDYNFMSESDSKLAASALLLALKMKGDDWSPNLKYSSDYEVSDLKETTSRLNHMLHKATTSGTKLTAVKNKYSHKIFFEVAKLPLLNKVEF